MPSKRGRTPKRPPPSQNEIALDRLTSRASNTYARIDAEMRRAMSTFMKGMKKRDRQLVAQAVTSAKAAATYAVALSRDLHTAGDLMNAIFQESVQPPTDQYPGPKLLEV